MTYHLNRQMRKVNISQNCITDTAAINSSHPKPPIECVCKPWEKNKALCKTKLWICWNTSFKVKVKKMCQAVSFHYSCIVDFPWSDESTSSFYIYIYKYLYNVRYFEQSRSTQYIPLIWFIIPSIKWVFQ